MQTLIINFSSALQTADCKLHQIKNIHWSSIKHEMNIKKNEQKLNLLCISGHSLQLYLYLSRSWALFLLRIDIIDDVFLLIISFEMAYTCNSNVIASRSKTYWSLYIGNVMMIVVEFSFVKESIGSKLN